MSMRKKLVSSIMAAVILLQSLGVFYTRAEQPSPNALEYGDYFILGSYLGEEIVWRHVGWDGYGDVALSFKVLTSKAYNSRGVKPENQSVPDGLNIPAEADPTGDRSVYGSNIWINSTLRAWLNSDAGAGEVRYIGNPPSSGSVTANPYDSEAGFLSNFTSAERAAMKTVLRDAALNEVDHALKTDGNQVPGWDNGSNLINPLRHRVTDTIFLPGAYLLSKIAADSALNWSVGYWSTGFHRAGITEAALDSASAPQTPAGEYNAVDYWTGTPLGSQWGGTHQMQIRLIGGGHSFVNVNEGVMGVRPAFYINHENITITGGSGTQDDPYTIGVYDDSFDMTVTLKGNNTEKLYAPDNDILQISVPHVTGLQLSYITVDPEIQLSIVNEADFVAYTPTDLSHTAGKATLTVDKNCTVYVMAKATAGGSAKTAFAGITYKNFYQPVKLYQEGRTNGDDYKYLYRATLVPGVYGVPLNTFRSNSLLSGAAYDTLNIPDALPADLQAYWTRAAGSAANVTLNSADYYTSPQTITNFYEKNSNVWVTVDFYFVDENSTSIEADGVSEQPLTKINWIPQGMKMSQTGAYFNIPDAADSSLTPYKWGMYDATDNFIMEYQEIDGTESIGFDPQMPDDKLHVAIRIYYKTDYYKVTEKFVIDGTDALLKTNMVSIASNNTYTHNSPPEIDHYVAVGYKIDENPRTDLETDEDGKPQWTNISKTVTQDLTVTFYYAADADGDGIPDKNQVRVTTRWIGVYNDSRPNAAIKQDHTQTVLKGQPVTIENDGSGGDAAHIIEENGVFWIFDASAGNPSVNITPGADTTVRFYYNIDSHNTGIPDIEHGVTVKYALYDNGSATYPPEWTEKFTGVIIGGTYTHTAPYRSGYVASGWLLDSESNYSTARPFSGSGGNPLQVKFETDNPKHTVTIVYRKAAEPVTFRWVGTVKTNNDEIEFGKVTVTGYVGETLDIDIDKLRASVSVDGESWMIMPSDTDNLTSITFTQSPQEYIFRYIEVENFYYDIHYISNGGKTLFEVKIPAKSTGLPFSIKPKEFPLYKYESYEIFEFGRSIGHGTSDSVTLTPEDGAMSVYFYYSPLTADVTVQAVNYNTGEVLHTEIYRDELVGSDFNVSSPYIAGWALNANESKSKSVTVAEGVNTITFYYSQILGNVHLLLKEDDANGRVITSEEHTLGYGVPATIHVPDLSHMYYTALSEPETVIYSGSDITIEYYYEKDTVQVIKRTYNPGGGGYIIEEYDMGMYRVGEIARFYAPVKDEYALDDEALKLIRINPVNPAARAAYYQEVSFYYFAVENSGRLAVEAVNQSGSILLSYNISGEEGEQITVDAPVIPGYRLAPGEQSGKEGTVSGKVTFVYQRESDSEYSDLTVTVKSSGGAVLKNAYVSAKNNGMKIRSNTAGDDGKAVLTDLPSGEYLISAVCDGYYDGAIPVTLNGDKDAVIILDKRTEKDKDIPALPFPTFPVPIIPAPEKPEPEKPEPETPEPAAPGGLLEKTKRIPYIFGFEDGTVRPDKYVTRAETAMIFYRLLKETHDTDGIAFPDVNEDAWYAEAVKTLSALGIVYGYPNGEFRPEITISRAEFAAIVSRFEKLEESDLNYFSDVKPEHWAKSYINSAYLKGWVSGYPGGEFRPDNPITRAEVVTLVNRLLGRSADKDEIPETSIYSDLQRDHWAYADFWAASQNE